MTGELEPYSSLSDRLRRAADEEAETQRRKEERDDWARQWIAWEFSRWASINAIWIKLPVVTFNNAPSAPRSFLSNSDQMVFVTAAVRADDLTFAVSGTVMQRVDKNPGVTLEEIQIVRQCEHCGELYAIWLMERPDSWGPQVTWSVDRFLLNVNQVLTNPDSHLVRDSLGRSVDCAASRVIDERLKEITSHAESPIEELFWAEVQRTAPPELAGLVQQYETGSYRLDLALPHLMIAIELDGYAYHSDQTTFVRDRERQRQLELSGWRVIRFAGAEVRRDITSCVAQTAAFVRLYGH